MIFNTGGGRTAGIGAVSILQQVLDYRDLNYRDPHNTGIRDFYNSIVSKFEFKYWDIFSVPIHPDNRGLAVYLCSDYYYYCRDQPTTTYILLAALFIVMVSALNPCKHV